MTKALLVLCIPGVLGVAFECRADLFKCVKDGKTSYQEQPCGGAQGAETKMQSAKASSWVGCYQMTAEKSMHTEKFEIRQLGDRLYMPMGKEGNYEQKFMMRPAAAEDLQGLKRQFFADKEREVASGLVVYELDSGWKVTPMTSDNGLRIGFYRVQAKGEPETLYTFLGVAFGKVNKVPCPKE